MLYNPKTLTLQELGLEPRLPNPDWNILEDEGFREVFDTKLFCYDYFFNHDCSQIIFICPRLLNNKFLLDHYAKFYLLIPGTKQIHSEIKPRSIFAFDIEILVFELGLDFTFLTEQRVEIYYTITYADKTLSCLLPTPNVSLAHRFIDRRIISTLNKNNDLVWIKDWLFWHYKHHGVDSVIIGDNNSTEYSLAELNECLANLSFLKSYVIVKWPFTHEASRLIRSKTGERVHLGACQVGFLNAILKNHLELAQGSLMLDIDELFAKSPKVFDPFEFTKDLGWSYVQVHNVFSSKFLPNHLENNDNLQNGIGFVDHDLKLPDLFYKKPYEIQDSDFKAGISYSTGKYIVRPSVRGSLVISFVHLFYLLHEDLKRFSFDLKQSKLTMLKHLNYMKYVHVWGAWDFYGYVFNLFSSPEPSRNILTPPFKIFHCRVLNKDWHEHTINRRLDWLKLLDRKEPELQLEYFTEIQDFFNKYKGTY